MLLFLGLALAQVAAGCGDPPGMSPLTRAAAANDAGLVKKLLADGAGVNEPDSGGMTPLIAATRRGALDAMRALFAAGADPNLAPMRGPRWAPIDQAIHTQQLDALRLLLEHGADP